MFHSVRRLKLTSPFYFCCFQQWFSSCTSSIKGRFMVVISPEPQISAAPPQTSGLLRQDLTSLLMLQLWWNLTVIWVWCKAHWKQLFSVSVRQRRSLMSDVTRPRLKPEYLHNRCFLHGGLLLEKTLKSESNQIKWQRLSWQRVWDWFSGESAETQKTSRSRCSIWPNFFGP